MTIIDEILIDLQGMGYTAPGLERVLGLNQGSIEIAKMTNDPEVIALLKIIKTYPWLLDVAEHNFDESMSKRIMFHSAIDAMMNDEHNRNLNKEI